MAQIDPYFEKLVEKHFGTDKIHVLEEINLYLKDVDDIASDSSVIYHMFSTFKSTPWQGNYLDTFNLAVVNASKYFPTDDIVNNENNNVLVACEKFIIASFVKFALKRDQDEKEGLGSDHYLSEVDDALEYDRYVKSHR